MPKQWVKVPSNTHEEIAWLANRIAELSMEFGQYKKECEHYEEELSACGFGLPCVTTCGPILCPLKDRR